MYWVQPLHPVLFQAAPRSVVGCTPLRHLHPVCTGCRICTPRYLKVVNDRAAVMAIDMNSRDSLIALLDQPGLLQIVQLVTYGTLG